MDPEPQVREEKPAEIEQQIEETRSSLADKLETLESEVMGTVHNVTGTVEETIEKAKETVEGTIEKAKETVDETVQAVKRTFDLHYQADRRPWTVMGLSCMAGFVSGALVQGLRHWQGSPGRSYGRSAMGFQSTPQTAAPAPSGPSFLNTLLDRLHPEIEKAKEMAIGAAVGLARDLLKQALPPSLTGQFTELMDSAATRLGGRPVAGPLVEPASPQTERATYVPPGQPAW